MQKMECTICGHVYNPEQGDEGVKPGVSFEECPDSWRCPICGAEKAKFRPV